MSNSVASALLLPAVAVGLLTACATCCPPSEPVRVGTTYGQTAPTGAPAPRPPVPTADTATVPATPPLAVVDASATMPTPSAAPPPAATPSAATTAAAAPAPVTPEPYRARPFDLARAGLAVANPSGWSRKRQDLALVYEGTMRVPSIVMFEPKARTLDAAVASLPEEIGAALQGVRIGREAARTRMAGYPAYVVEGTGRAEGFPMRWRATVVDAQHPTIVLALTPTFFWGANKSRIARFEQTITRSMAQVALPPPTPGSTR